LVNDFIYSAYQVCKSYLKQITNLEDKVKTLEAAARLHKPQGGGGYGAILVVPNQGSGRGRGRGRGNGEGRARVDQTASTKFFEVRKTICKFYNDEATCFRKEKCTFKHVCNQRKQDGSCCQADHPGLEHV
jgi:hypothetical protein